MKNAGFTLLEVLIAVAILGIGCTAALKAGLMAQDALIEAQNVDLALPLAQSKLAEVEAAGPSNWMVMDGDFSPDHPEVSWELEIQSTSLPKLYRVRIQVRAEDAQPVVLERLTLQL